MGVQYQMSGSILTFSEDITNAEAPPPLPVGPYPAEIVGAQRRTSATSGKDYAQIVMRINAESYPADYTDGDPDGTTLSYNRLQMDDTPQSRWRWRQFMERVGGPMGRSVDLNALVGLTCTVDITHQEYEGEDRAQITRILAP
jgi:hypothetical protein